MNKFQILVVEDDAPVRNLITTTLRANNYRFITAGSGESAGRFEDQAVVRRRKNASTHHCTKRSADVSR